MPVVKLRGLPEDNASITDILDHVAMLQKTMEYHMNHMDSKNITEVGGWIIKDNMIVSESGLVGMYSGELGPEDVRFWAGSTDMNSAPFRVLENGAVIADSLDIDDKIQAAIGEIDLVVSNTIVTNVLAADKGYIAELTVDQLETSDKVQRYLAGDKSNVDYIRAKDQYIQWITARTTGQTEQAKDRNGNLLYWKNADHLELSDTPTDFPITIYKYTEQVKRKIGFEEVDGVQTPVDVYGVGNGLGDNGKGYIKKTVEGLVIEYRSSTGKLRQIKLTDSGVYVTPSALQSLQFYSNGFKAQYEGQLIAYTWTKDSEGRITRLSNTDGIIPVTWNGGEMSI